jgi:hypothetical protein
MPSNVVQVDFVGNPTQLFATADEVNARLNKLAGVNPSAAIDKLTNSIKIASPQVTNFTNATETGLKKATSATDALTVSTDKLTKSEQKAAAAAAQHAENLKASGNATIGSSRGDIGPDDIFGKSPAPQPISDAQFRRGQQLAAANAEAEIDKKQRATALENSKAKLEIYRAEKASEVALEEQTAGKIKMVRGFGALFRATGLTALGINEAEINAGIALYNKFGAQVKVAAAASEASTAAGEALAAAQAHATATAETLAVAQGNAAISATALAGAEEGAAIAAGEVVVAEEAAAVAATEAAAATGLFTSALTAVAAVGVGPIVAGLALVAAAAYVVYHITSDIAETEAKKLKMIEAQAIAYGKASSELAKQRQLTFDALADQQKQFAHAEEKAKLDKNTNLELLQAQLERIKNEDKLLQGTGDAEGRRQRMLDLGSRINTLQNERSPEAVAAQRSKFESEAFDRAEAERKTNEEERQKREEEAAKKRVELAKQSVEAIRSLTVQANADNPFVKIFSDADKALETLRKNLQGLKPELELVAENLQKTIVANQLYAARLDAKLEAFNLRQKAEEFRNPPLTDEQAKERLARSERNFLADNPNFTFLKREEFNARQADTRDPLSYNGQSFQDFLKKEIDKTIPEFIRDPATYAQRTRLDAQIGIINASKASNPQQQAANDQRLISLASGIDPNKLDLNERNQVASALERRAEAAETREIDALKIQNESAGYLKAIASTLGVSQETLNAIAQNAQNQKTDITLKDDTSDKKATAVTATPNDVGSMYQANNPNYVPSYIGSAY